MNIRPDDLSGERIQALLAAHLRGMHDHSPPESVHALDLEGLRAPDVTFWSAWAGDDLLGCAALRELNPGHGEIKSMRTATPHLGKGVASALVEHILGVARERGYDRLSLETGSGPAFEPAHALYGKYGFEFCGPFGDYTNDPFSRFMTLRLDPVRRGPAA
ncbi:MAG: GNAT family N-acetyltransferase [Woeseiaceae bacterium]|nr:GNAT family N-acetyltransferase [Woeseiaceae bacterium]